LKNQFFIQSSLGQANCIVFQETGATAAHVKTEAFALMKLPVIGAIADLDTLD